MEETEKKETKKRPKSRIRFFLPVYAIILFLLLAVIYIYPSVTGALSKTMTIEFGSLRNSYDLTLYIVRDETVYYAAENSSVGYYYPGGTALRAGTEIITTDLSGTAAEPDEYGVYNKCAHRVENMAAVLSEHNRMDEVEAELRQELERTDNEQMAGQINRYLAALGEFSENGIKDTSGPSDNYNEVLPDSSFGVTGNSSTLTSGTLSYKMDGYEAAFNPHTMSLLDREKLESLEYCICDFNTGRTLKGEPMFKIVDTRRWYAVTWIDESSLGAFAEGNSITVDLPKGSVYGTVNKLYDDGDEIMMILEFDGYYEDYTTIRKVDAKVMTSNSEGLIVESSFITTQDGEPGVIVVDVTGETSFVPVKILGSDGTNMIVASGYFYRENEQGTLKQIKTVHVYDEIKMPESGSATSKAGSGQDQDQEKSSDEDQ